MSDCEKDDKGRWKLDSTSVNVYASLIRLRNQELSTHWTRYHVFAAINTAVILAFANFSGSHGGHAILFCLGIILTIVWLLFAYFGKKQLSERWDKELENFEAEVSEECGFHAFLTKWHNIKGPIHYLQLIVPFIFFIIWIGAIVFWQPGATTQEKITKAVGELKAETTSIHKTIEKHEDAILKLQATLAAQASSNAVKRNP